MLNERKENHNNYCPILLINLLEFLQNVKKDDIHNRIGIGLLIFLIELAFLYSQPSSIIDPDDESKNIEPYTHLPRLY
jgi:hypothetical protein